MNDLRARAEQVLRDNDRDGFTVPTDSLYPFQWLWDAGFTALGWATFSEPRAWQELETLFQGQWSDGMLPHIVFHKPEPAYFPGADVWGTTHDPPTSGITQPPVIATVVSHLIRTARDVALAERTARGLYPKMLAFHRWLHRARDPQNTGLVCILHPWEAGTDNSPMWDAALSRVPVDPNLSPYTRRDTGHVDPSQRPHQHQYDRYLSLVKAFRDAAYDPEQVWQTSAFRVADVGFNAILHRANLDLLWLAQRFGEPTPEIETWLERGGRGLETLWDEAAGYYYSFDRITHERITIPTSSSFLPLFARTPSTERANRLISNLEAWADRVQFLVPSTDPRHSAFEPRRYWCGPVWAIMNWMIGGGLHTYGRQDLLERLRHDTLELVMRSGFAEYFDPNTAEGLGGGHFSWTAAIVLVWTHDFSPGSST